jgi:hypothetical protein
MATFSCVGMWNSWPKFAQAFQLQPACAFVHHSAESIGQNGTSIYIKKVWLFTISTLIMMEWNVFLRRWFFYSVLTRPE